MATTNPTLHQFAHAAVVGDAITDQIFAIRRWLRAMGYTSDIYALHCHEELLSEVKLISRYRPKSGEQYLMYHHSVGSEVVGTLLKSNLPLILVYHNITPPDFYRGVDPALARQLEEGRTQLKAIRELATLALGDSYYSTVELTELGYDRTAVLPIVLDKSNYAMPSNAELVDRYGDKKPIILFVGRLAPNKRQEDLIKLLYFFRRIHSRSHLLLVGSIHHRDYHGWLQELSKTLGIEDGVTFTGHVTQQDMVTYYRLADVYISMSEHEGFGKPLIESMYLDLPLMAYASSAVPDTMGDAGILFHHKDYEALAEMADMLVAEAALRQRVLSQQKQRVHSFLEESVKEQLQQLLGQLNILPLDQAGQ